MPKGVEHMPSHSGQSWVRGLQPSLMPKGVEHLGRPSGFSIEGLLQPSLMPKGVEHCVTHEVHEVIPPATLTDAERR